MELPCAYLRSAVSGEGTSPLTASELRHKGPHDLRSATKRENFRAFPCALCLLLMPGVVCAQSSSEKLDSSPNNPDVAAQLKTLREALMRTQQQVAAQQQEIQTLKARRTRLAFGFESPASRG